MFGATDAVPLEHGSLRDTRHSTFNCPRGTTDVSQSLESELSPEAIPAGTIEHPVEGSAPQIVNRLNGWSAVPPILAQTVSTRSF